MTIINNPTEDLVINATQERQKIAVVFDLENTSRKWKVTVVSNNLGGVCEVRILSKLSASNLECSADLQIKKGANESRLSWYHQAFLADTESNITTIPLLRIEQDQVQCAHGVSVASFDPTQIEYLAARGLTRQDAESVLYSALYQSLCDWVLTK